MINPVKAAGLVVVTILVAIVLAGCPSMPVQSEPLAQLQGQVIAVRKTCIDLLNRDRLTVEGGTRCLLVTNQVSDGIAISRATGTVADLESANRALIELERYLKDQTK